MNYSVVPELIYDFSTCYSVTLSTDEEANSLISTRNSEESPIVDVYRYNPTNQLLSLISSFHYPSRISRLLPYGEHFLVIPFNSSTPQLIDEGGKQLDELNSRLSQYFRFELIQTTSEPGVWLGYSEILSNLSIHSNQDTFCVYLDSYWNESISLVEDSIDPIDIYAMNAISNNEIWLSFYPDNDLFHFVDNVLVNHYRGNLPSFSNAIAIQEEYAGFATAISHTSPSATSENLSQVVLCNLEDLDEYCIFEVVDEEGKSINYLQHERGTFQTVKARKDRLYFFEDKRLYTITMDDMLSKL